MIIIRIDSNTVIYGYLAVCILLLIFNLGYVYISERRKKNHKARIGKWRQEILYQINQGKVQNFRPLKKINHLIYYSRVLEQIKQEQPDALSKYLYANYMNFQETAFYYKRRSSMDRAFFADIIGRFPPCNGSEYLPLMEILISYMDNSTLYCRENVLKALYAIGNCQAVENALQIINDRSLFHHRKLISDGMTAFKGDKETLAAVLWRHYKEWDYNLMAAIVDFIANCSPNYKEIFLPTLCAKETNLEIRLAIMRYYRRNTYEPVKSILLGFLKGEDSLAIVAATVLESYHCADTELALKKVLRSRNWYVRYNAAASLVNMEVSEEDLQDILQGEDKYAKEILAYKLKARCDYGSVC